MSEKIHVVQGQVKPMSCLLERGLIKMGFVVVKDGSLRRDFQSSAGEPTYYVKVLRAKIDGEFINTWVKMVYDLRTGYADFNISHKDLDVYEEALSKAATVPASTPAAPTAVTTDNTLAKVDSNIANIDAIIKRIQGEQHGIV